MPKIKKLPEEFSDPKFQHECEIILFLGDGSKANDEGYTPFPVLVDWATQQGWQVFHAFDQLRMRWAAVQQPPGTDHNRYALTDLGQQYYEMLKAKREKSSPRQGVKDAEPARAPAPARPGRRR